MDRVLQALVHAQTHLDGAPDLAELAAIAGLSPHHFHRVFRERLGETPKQHVLRLQLERAALLLHVTHAPVTEVGLLCGFRRPETFARAFRRRFGHPPSQWRQLDLAGAERGAGIEQASEGSLSSTTFVSFPDRWLAFRRHVGPYEDAPVELFADVQRWARAHGVPAGLLVGVARDAPGITPPDKLRFDAGLLLDDAPRASGRIAVERFAGGRHALTRYAGPFSGLEVAYMTIAERVLAAPGVTLIGLPALELYRATPVGHDQLHTIDIALPVRAS